MGLDATVMCNCLRDGLASEPPFPRDWLKIDSDGYLNLKPEFDSDDNFLGFVRWRETACVHSDMDAASERISNWTGYRLFQEALGTIGWERFPVLKRELPDVNGGQTDSTAAAGALGELAEFRRIDDAGTAVFLVDPATGETIQRAVAAYEGVFIMDGRSGLDAGFDPIGFFIRDRDSRVERFRALRFTQTLLDPEAYMHGPEPGRVVFQSLDSGETFECRLAVSGGEIPWPDGRMQDDRGRCRFEHPARLHVELRRERAADYEYVLQPLEIVFRASVETGNPVRWC